MCQHVEQPQGQTVFTASSRAAYSCCYCIQELLVDMGFEIATVRAIHHLAPEGMSPTYEPVSLIFSVTLQMQPVLLKPTLV